MLEAGLVLLGLTAFAVGLLSGRSNSLFLAVANRWMRWLAVAALTAYMLIWLEWVLVPFPILFTVCFMGWFLLETIYFWLALKAWSQGEAQVFPRFEANEQGDEWPSEKPFIQLREDLRKRGFQRQQALIAVREDGPALRVSVFANQEETTRLHVMFVPQPRGKILACFSIHSEGQDGVRLVTDNVFLPFGGFYPDNWQLERRPWKRSLAGLLARHVQRQDAHGGPFTPLERQPSDEMNADLRKLEALNRELGFLTAPEDEEELGLISPAGRYRLWQELWLLSYFGRSLRY